jgi:hypothetical protein
MILVADLRLHRIMHAFRAALMDRDTCTAARHLALGRAPATPCMPIPAMSFVCGDLNRLGHDTSRRSV